MIPVATLFIQTPQQTQHMPRAATLQKQGKLTMIEKRQNSGVLGRRVSVQSVMQRNRALQHPACLFPVTRSEYPPLGSFGFPPVLLLRSRITSPAAKVLTFQPSHVPTCKRTTCKPCDYSTYTGRMGQRA